MRARRDYKGLSRLRLQKPGQVRVGPCRSHGIKKDDHSVQALRRDEEAKQAQPILFVLAKRCGDTEGLCVRPKEFDATRSGSYQLRRHAGLSKAS